MEPPPASTTDQVTALFEALCTVAVSVNDDPVFSTADGPTTVTVTRGEGGAGALPPPQPDRHAAANNMTPVCMRSLPPHPAARIPPPVKLNPSARTSAARYRGGHGLRPGRHRREEQ